MDDLGFQNAISELKRLQNQVAELAHNNELLRQQLEREREEHRSQTAIFNKAFDPESVQKDRERSLATTQRLAGRVQELEGFVTEVAGSRTKFAGAAKKLAS